MALTTVRPQGMGFNTGRRNMVINGAMQVAQRGTSFDAAQQYLCDRWRFGRQTDGYDLTWAQSTTAPDGLANSLKMDVTTADASLNADVFALVQQRVEGQNLQMLKKGTSAAESVTVSFYVRSAKTGTYILELKDKDNGRQISKSYTIGSADTWEYKSITFEGDTTGAFDNDNARSLDLNWWLAAGTNFSSGTLATSWQADADTNRAVGQVNIFDSTSNDWYITGVQMELGENASDFEHRSFAEELALCSRYYKQYKATTAYNQFAFATTESTTLHNALFVFNPPLRDTPSSVSVTGNIGIITNWGLAVTAINASAIMANVKGPTSTTVQFTTDSAVGTAGDVNILLSSNNANSTINFDAEL